MRKKIFLLLLAPILLYSFSLPKEPEVKSPEVKDETNNGTLRPATIEVYKSNFKLKGNVRIKDFKLKLKTEKEGFVFYKEIPLDSIKEVTILEWKGTLYDKEKASYIFYPIKYIITDKNNISFEYKQNIKELNRLTVDTPYGKTIIFSIFFDYFNGKKWESGIEGAKLIRESPIQKVFIKITFEEN